VSRLLRSVAKGEPIAQDVSTLKNLVILEQLDEAHRRRLTQRKGLSRPRS